ncbi:MAG: NAD-dependent epimerase/dehydratase family protein [Betaproteobacteria bacterium]|nr:NAD-dependent epimerase/dehydratase family protein [Betaproteobacteria bacterium]
MNLDEKILLPGGAGLVGQNLLLCLRRLGYRNLVVLDKHRENLEILRRVHPGVVAEFADLAEPGDWEAHFAGAAVVVILQAQIGGSEPEPFVRNNIDSTRRILDLVERHAIPCTVHISSSVVESVADDHYTRTKKEQERLVLERGIPCVVLRPTLMFGWFDRKHLGWLARFMKKVPVFPIPGSGRYLRQPLYAGDFCAIIASCIATRRASEIFNITGLETLDYIDIIRAVKRAARSKTLILNIPYALFHALLRLWALFDRNPPFTADQLKSLAAHDIFEVIDWPAIFDVAPTPFAEAIEQTFSDPDYSGITLKF